MGWDMYQEKCRSARKEAGISEGEDVYYFSFHPDGSYWDTIPAAKAAQEGAEVCVLAVRMVDVPLQAWTNRRELSKAEILKAVVAAKQSADRSEWARRVAERSGRLVEALSRLGK